MLEKSNITLQSNSIRDATASVQFKYFLKFLREKLRNLRMCILVPYESQTWPQIYIRQYQLGFFQYFGQIQPHDAHYHLVYQLLYLKLQSV